MKEGTITKPVAAVALGMMAYGQLCCPSGPKRDAFFDLPFVALLGSGLLEFVVVKATR